MPTNQKLTYYYIISNKISHCSHLVSLMIGYLSSYTQCHCDYVQYGTVTSA
jgi:hypothetical protein